MVDATKGIGQLPSVTQAEKPQAPVKRRDETEATDKKRRDEEVQKKKKDLSASEAEETARDTAKKIANSNQSLAGKNFDETV